MAAIIAPTSVRQLLEQGMTAEQIRAKAEEYEANGQILWGWPEYHFWHFYQPGSSTRKAYRRPVDKPVVSDAKKQVESKPVTTQRSTAIRRAKGSMRPWESELCRICKIDQDAPVANYISQLPPQQRRYVHLRFCEGKSIAEIADIASVAKSSVSPILSKAYTRIRQMYHAERRARAAK